MHMYLWQYSFGQELCKTTNFWRQFAENYLIRPSSIFSISWTIRLWHWLYWSFWYVPLIDTPSILREMWNLTWNLMPVCRLWASLIGKFIHGASWFWGYLVQLMWAWLFNLALHLRYTHGSLAGSFLYSHWCQLKFQKTITWCKFLSLTEFVHAFSYVFSRLKLFIENNMLHIHSIPWFFLLQSWFLRSYYLFKREPSSNFSLLGFSLKHFFFFEQYSLQHLVWWTQYMQHF